MVFGKKKLKEQFKKVNPEGEVAEANPMKELVAETDTAQKEERVFQVVKELPLEPVREAKTEDGTIITYLTIEEALTEFINKVGEK